MFAVKFFNKKIKENKVLNRTIKNVSDFLRKDMSKEVNIISDSNSTEIISGNLENNNCDITVELMFKKTISISSDDANDLESLDKFVKEIKHFCKQVSIIDNNSYIPIEYRVLDEDTNDK
tara:strand:- start:497 stop:856 length:360 start_codon:yes stop_codon:yes gene_type:complete